MVQWVGIQKQPSKGYRKRHMPLSIEGYVQEMSALMEFDVADVAYAVLILGEHLISKRYVFSHGEHKCYMAKDGVHKLTHCPYADWCDVRARSKAKNNQKQSMGIENERRGAKVQMDCTSMSGDDEMFTKGRGDT